MTGKSKSKDHKRPKNHQKHLRWTMAGPHSSYSCLEIHICWKVEREARMDPPIQTEYFLSGGAMILILMVDGARAVISFCIRSAIPGYMVVPPDMTVLAYRSSWMPQASIPRKEGWKRASGQRKRSLPMVMTWPSGSSEDFSREVEAAAVAISCSKSRAT